MAIAAIQVIYGLVARYSSYFKIRDIIKLPVFKQINITILIDQYGHAGTGIISYFSHIHITHTVGLAVCRYPSVFGIIRKEGRCRYTEKCCAVTVKIKNCTIRQVRIPLANRRT
ncbi:hypothetical protein D3C86_1583710 [compost metagenome]